VGASHLGKQDLLCSLIGLGVKLGLVVVTGVSLVRVASAYQARMDRQGELAAVLQIENAQLTKAQQRFDRLFLISGEKTLAREQSQWIAPNRLRVVWQAPAAPAKAPVAPAKAPENAQDPAPQRPPGPLASAPLKDSATVPPTGTGGLAQPGNLGGN
jgi:type II secretory pathway pseudopilin PulG